MQFRLTFEGTLLADSSMKPPGQEDLTYAKNKHEIRKKFHPQMRELWRVEKALAMNESYHNGSNAAFFKKSGHQAFGTMGEAHTIGKLSATFSKHGYKFVPLLTEAIHVTCELEILLLRPGAAGKVYGSGDVDNRLKILIDALCMPKHANQLRSYPAPESDEDPFFCVLEDDSLISKITVEADTLLEPTFKAETDARAVVTVRTRPTQIGASNIPFL